MPVDYFTAAAVRAAEAATGDLLTSGALMQRAATGVANVVAAHLVSTGGCYGRGVGLVVGAGDNGGDALFAGALLARRGVSVCAVLLNPERAHPAGLAALRRSGGRVVERLPATMDAVVDGVVGIGGHGPLRESAATVFASVTAPVFAVDLPSGIDADTGVVHDPAVSADVTVTFGVRRNAHLLAAPHCGRVVLIDIGLGDLDGADLRSWTDDEVGRCWPVPGPADDKYTQGVVGVVAGSPRYPGAGVLCTGAAIHATSGLTRYAGSAGAQVLSRFPEVVVSESPQAAGRVQAWIVGPGFGVDDDALARLRTVLAADVPVLVDADGLTMLAAHPELLAARTAATLLTPHAGEFARLAGQPLGPDRLAAVRDLAQRLGVTVLLKGRGTLIAGPEPSTPVIGNDAGSSWAATAGSGDVLAGLAGALLASGRSPVDAAAMAARVHSVAAAIGADDAPLGASRLLGAIPAAITRLRRAAGASVVRQ
ncbi:NAD(P)H-hydrate dehydratase [Gordonia sp. TBRC 11910]|uniref:Bifunctional NAD(P)H-hydrate repair enzyme n=1 Tax=Gordonia asplenii TaxID=2725283 RepID=A0A848L454_9ACTN|nr:NAD(P)H-hydrate dehydratase [Gordonia asplenii]NMO02408.1 NAD(P)H-hydrate dehydratase [Gordonia asplenii]